MIYIWIEFKFIKFEIRNLKSDNWTQMFLHTTLAETKNQIQTRMPMGSNRLGFKRREFELEPFFDLLQWSYDYVQ